MLWYGNVGSVPLLCYVENGNCFVFLANFLKDAFFINHPTPQIPQAEGESTNRSTAATSCNVVGVGHNLCWPSSTGFCRSTETLSSMASLGILRPCGCQTAACPVGRKDRGSPASKMESHPSKVQDHCHAKTAFGMVRQLLPTPIILLRGR